MDLPVEILNEIFVRLQVRDVLNMRLTSRHHLSVLSKDSGFWNDKAVYDHKMQLQEKFKEDFNNMQRYHIITLRNNFPRLLDKYIQCNNKEWFMKFIDVNKKSPGAMMVCYIISTQYGCEEMKTYVKKTHECTTRLYSSLELIDRNIPCKDFVLAPHIMFHIAAKSTPLVLFLLRYGLATFDEMLGIRFFEESMQLVKPYNFLHVYKEFEYMFDQTMINKIYFRTFQMQNADLLKVLMKTFDYSEPFKYVDRHISELDNASIDMFYHVFFNKVSDSFM